MTREEEIKRAASEVAKGSLYPTLTKRDFVEGAEWADAHPHWNDMSNEPQKYDDFLVITKGGCMDFAHFNQDGWHKSHYDGSSDFLYWMTPPAMPKGGEE